MPALRKLLCVLAFIVVAPGTFAHSLRELETELGNREKYFQPIGPLYVCPWQSVLIYVNFIQ